MKVFNCILGIFSIFGAVYCIWFPGMTFLNAGWILTVLLGVWGICAIFEFFSNRKKGKSSGLEAPMGVFGLIAGIAAAILSIITIFKPGISLILDMFVIGIFVVWLIFGGISSIVKAVKDSKTADSSLWILSLVLGIISLIGGLYGIFHIIYMAQTIGLLIGWLFMLYGIRLICSVFEQDK